MTAHTKTRIATLFALFLVLTGCDTGDPAVPFEEKLVGSWNLSVLQADTYLTSETAQEIIDPDEVGTGQITLTGELQEELSYLRRALPTLESALPFYTSDVPLGELGFSAPSDEAVRLRVLPGDPVRADLFVGDELRYSAEGGEGITLDPASNTVTFESAALSGADGAVVAADGSLQAATQPLPAGEKTRAGGFALEVARGTLLLTFADDGTYEAQSTNDDGETETSTGRWRLEGGELVLETEEDGQLLPPQRARYSISEDQLTLEDTEIGFFNAGGEEELLSIYESTYGAEEGTLTGVQQRGDLQFEATSAP